MAVSFSPRFLAPDAPGLGSDMRDMANSGSAFLAIQPSTAFHVPSVEPLSTTITFRGRRVCLLTLSRHLITRFSLFLTGITTVSPLSVELLFIVSESFFLR